MLVSTTPVPAPVLILNDGSGVIGKERTCSSDIPAKPTFIPLLISSRVVASFVVVTSIVYQGIRRPSSNIAFIILLACSSLRPLPANLCIEWATLAYTAPISTARSIFLCKFSSLKLSGLLKSPKNKDCTPTAIPVPDNSSETNLTHLSSTNKTFSAPSNSPFAFAAINSCLNSRQIVRICFSLN